MAATPPRPAQAFAPCRFGQIHYRTAQPEIPTKKLPLLFMHASPGSALFNEAFIALMGKERRIIAPDTPGYGLSDRPPTQPRIEDFAAAMGDLVDALGLTKIDILGNHTSSGTAVELVRQRPGLVRRIILNSAQMYTEAERADFRANYYKGAAPDLETAVARMGERWSEYRKLRSDLSAEDAWLGFWETYRDPTHSNWGYNASFSYDFPKTFRQIKEPVLVLNPKDVLFEMTSRARGVGPNIQVIDLPWAGGTFGIHADKTAKIIREFLDT